MAFGAAQEKQIAKPLEVCRAAVPIQKIGRRKENRGRPKLGAGFEQGRASFRDWSLGSDGHESCQMATRGSAGNSKPFRIDKKFNSVLLDVANSGFDVRRHLGSGV